MQKKIKSDRYQTGIASMFYKLFDKKSWGNAVTLAQSETLATWATQDESAI